MPEKSNFRELRGIDAVTGASNFDICEYIVMKIAEEYRGTNAVIAMLCKTSVARNVFAELRRREIGFSNCEILEFDAKEVFGVSVDACLFVIELSTEATFKDDCLVYELNEPQKVKSRFGFMGGRFYSKMDDAEERIDGKCCFEWRQGVKHDCAKVMELEKKGGILKNRRGQEVHVEDDVVFPLVKSSAFKIPLIHKFNNYVIVTQRKPRESTEHLREDSPATWQYLTENDKDFENRKSSIYRGTPRFSMFGVGDYSFATYKVGVSGLLKRPMFGLLFSDDKKPVMTDDASYFIGFENYDMAYVAMTVLNSERVQDFLLSVAAIDSKRPYTKKVLERIDFGKALQILKLPELIETEQKLGLGRYIDSGMLEQFREMCSGNE